MRADNFTNTASLQTGVIWDPAQLTFTEINEVGITGITPNDTEASNGELRLLWIIGFSDDPVTLDDQSILFEVWFDVLSGDGESAEVNLVSLMNFSVEVASGEGITLDVCTQNGRVNVGEASDGGGTGGGDTGGGDTGGGDTGGGDSGGGDTGGGDTGGGDSGGGDTGGGDTGGGSQGGTENMCADSDDTSLVIQGGSVEAGSNICFPITNENWVEIASLQTGFAWDSDIFEFTGINERTLTGITLNESDANIGELRILWLVPLGADNLSPEDGSVLFEICFDAVGSDGQSSALEFVELTNFGIEIANGSGQTQSLCISQGSASVGDGDGGGGTGGGGTGGGTGGGGTGGGNGDGEDLCAGTSDFAFITPIISVEAGQNVCIPITTSNFTTIASIQAGITWDSNVLNYTGLNEVGITGISLNEAEVDNGELKLLWLIGLGDDPVTLDDGTTLFELCFDAVGADSESSTIDIEDLPGFVIEVASGEGVPLPVCVDNGFIQIGDDVITPPPGGGGGGGGGDLSVSIGSVSNAMTGQISCVDIDVANFEDIQSAQFDIQWDPAFMTFNNLMDPEVLSSFGPGNQNQTSGNLRISWSPVSALDLADNTTIFTLCFDVIGSCDGPSSSPVAFVESATVGVEFTNSSNTVIPVDIQSGAVSIDCSDIPIGPIGPGVITSPACADDNTGSIMVSAPTGFIAPVTCTYTREDGSVIRSSTSDCNLISVPAGIYTLTATDAVGNSRTRTFEITSPGSPDISFATTDATCTTGGSITTQLLGGIPPFSFAWGGGLPPTQNQMDLEPATYQVTISDSNGCTFVRTVPLGGSINTGEPLAISLVALEDGTCAGGSRIEIQPTGGCSGYTYAWTGPNGETSICLLYTSPSPRDRG